MREFGFRRQHVLHIDEASSGQTVSLPNGQIAELRLRENPTTGFRWRTRHTGEPNCRIKEDFLEPATASPPGEGRVHIWRIEAIQIGVCELSLNYVRAWDDTQPPARSFEVHISVIK